MERATGTIPGGVLQAAGAAEELESMANYGQHHRNSN